MRRFAPTAVLALLALCCSTIAFAQKNPELNNPMPHTLPTPAGFVQRTAGAGGTGGSLVYHNGPVMPTAFVIPIFWGPNWATGGADNSKAVSITNYIAAYGQTGEYNVITQYSQTTGG